MKQNSIPYKVWSEIVKVFLNNKGRAMSLDELEIETGLEKRNIQLALYRAVKRGEARRLTHGLYKYSGDEEYDDTAMLDYSSSKEVHIKSPEYGYEIFVPKPNVRVLDEIIGQLKLIRNQMAH